MRTAFFDSSVTAKERSHYEEENLQNNIEKQLKDSLCFT